MTAEVTSRKRGRILAADVAATTGNVVTIEVQLEPEQGFVPEPLFDTTGTLSFILGQGNYLPGLHELIQGMSVGDTKGTCADKDDENKVSLDAGWGQRRDDLIVTVPKSKLKSIPVDSLKIGSALNLQGGLKVTVTEILDDAVVLDANPPLAGSSYACNLTVMAVKKVPEYKFEYHDPVQHVDDSSRYQVCTFALGCFWGAELAFQRQVGVVGTGVGYSQGRTVNPTYNQVCAGKTQHREAVQVVFDSTQTSFEALLQTAVERLAATAPAGTEKAMRIFDQAEDEVSSQQYRHGVYFHTEEQRKVTQDRLEASNAYQIEVLPANTFYRAEDWHQQFLLKGGQSARKGAKETIRCFG